MADTQLRDRLADWQAEGLIDTPTAARIEAFEAGRPQVEIATGRITVSEVVAYIGAIVLLVGVGFLYGTEYQSLGTAGRLILIGLVAAGGFAAGELVRRTGAAAAPARRARAAGWSVGGLAASAWLAQAFTDFHVLTRPNQYEYAGAPVDASGAIMLAAAIGTVLAAVLLWRAGAGLIAFVLAALAYATAFTVIAYSRETNPGWAGEVAFLVPAVLLAVASELLARGPDRRWAREVMRFAAVLVPTLIALVLSGPEDHLDLELFAGVLAIAGFALAFVRSSAGYAIAAGIALFVFVNEVGFRHFANTVGFPVVLIVSGIALFVIAGGMVGVLRRLRRPA